ncbi:MAG: hypothetical protein K9I94_03775 [Bacteroidales bacterium]|nr:hypothetical protein [Bacteroidales bacterium]
MIVDDTTLSFISMIEIYQIRWSIEVFFKESRKLLRLGKCQSTNFDAKITDTTSTMIQHLLLTLHHRFEVYEAKGALFAHIEEQMLRTRLDQRFWGLFQELIRIITHVFEDIEEMELMEKIMTDEKVIVFLLDCYLYQNLIKKQLS